MVITHATKKSQIDFVLTNNTGRVNVTDYSIVKSGWHFSGYLPLDLMMKVSWNLNLLAVLVRSKELLHYNPLNRNSDKIKLCNVKVINVENAKRLLSQDAYSIAQDEYSIAQDAYSIAQDAYSIAQEIAVEPTPDKVLETIYKHIEPIIRQTAIKIRIDVPVIPNHDMTSCDESFNNYLDLIRIQPTNIYEIKQAYDIYQSKRNDLHVQFLERSYNQYKNVLQSNDDRKLWKMISWSGKIEKGNSSCTPAI